MSSTHASTTFRPSRSGRESLAVLAAQTGAFVEALLQPGKLIREVEGMARLLAEARRIEARQPERAAQLRRQAARACR